VDGELTERLDRIESLLAALVEQKILKDFYTTAEVGKILGKSDYTVREWCRQGRVHGSKRECGRGTASEWVIARAELDRIRNEGLRPLRIAREA
jgi:Helix-turn-helix domain